MPNLTHESSKMSIFNTYTTSNIPTQSIKSIPLFFYFLLRNITWSEWECLRRHPQDRAYQKCAHAGLKSDTYGTTWTLGTAPPSTRYFQREKDTGREREKKERLKMMVTRLATEKLSLWFCPGASEALPPSPPCPGDSPVQVWIRTQFLWSWSPSFCWPNIPGLKPSLWWVRNMDEGYICWENCVCVGR